MTAGSSIPHRSRRRPAELPRGSQDRRSWHSPDAQLCERDALRAAQRPQPADAALSRAAGGMPPGMTPMNDAFLFGPFRLAGRPPRALAARRAGDARPARIRCPARAGEPPGQLVTKDDLMAAVWPGVVVEENNMQVHVSALRKVLASAGDGERYLLTVAGRGYRFVAPVTRECRTSSTPPAIRCAASAAPARSSAADVANNLPQQLTSLIGREAELAESRPGCAASAGDADRRRRRRQDAARDRSRHGCSRILRTASGWPSSHRSTIRSWSRPSSPTSWA